MADRAAAAAEPSETSGVVYHGGGVFDDSDDEGRPMLSPTPDDPDAIVAYADRLKARLDVLAYQLANAQPCNRWFLGTVVQKNAKGVLVTVDFDLKVQTTPETIAALRLVTRRVNAKKMRLEHDVINDNVLVYLDEKVLVDVENQNVPMDEWVDVFAPTHDDVDAEIKNLPK